MAGAPRAVTHPRKGRRTDKGRHLAWPPVPARTRQPLPRNQRAASRAGPTPSATSRPSYGGGRVPGEEPRHEHGGDRRRRRGRADDPVRPLQDPGRTAGRGPHPGDRRGATSARRGRRRRRPARRARPPRRGELARRRPAAATSSRRLSGSCPPSASTRPTSRYSAAFRR